MRKPSHRLILSVAVIGVIGRASAVIFGSERTDAASLAIVVHDRAQTLPDILDRAVKEATRLYRHAGVSTDWQVSATRAGGSVVDASQPSPAGFTIQLIIQASSRGAGDHRSVLMGAAPTTRDCGGTVYVFQDQVARFASEQQLAVPLVLGTVMAHEVGHVLLPRHGHSKKGLMRASWDATDWQHATVGSLLFFPDDIATIRATLSPCRA